MAEAFADKRYGNPAALHDRGERVAGRISGKRRYADLRGYPPEGIVALAYHLTDRYGRPDHFRPAIGAHCLGAGKTYLPIHYAAVFQEEHVPEIYTVAQI